MSKVTVLNTAVDYIQAQNARIEEMQRTIEVSCLFLLEVAVHEIAGADVKGTSSTAAIVYEFNIMSIIFRKAHQ